MGYLLVTTSTRSSPLSNSCLKVGAPCQLYDVFLFSSSNCVVNLTADKKIVLKEALRVLKVLYLLLKCTLNMGGKYRIKMIIRNMSKYK